MIGIFDSGSGGLTVMRAIREQMPSSDIIYFGDIKNAPYGEKSHAELSVLTMQAIELLMKRGAKSIVSACNSVSASLAVSLFDALSIAPDHLIEMVGPTVGYLKKSSARILLVATTATVNSGIYQNAFRLIGKDIEVLAIPELASAIEFGKPEEEIESIIRDAFKSVELEEIDAVILACTHYPLAIKGFSRALGDSIALFDPADAVGERVRRQLWPMEAGDGRTHFVISKDSQPFRDRVATLFTESMGEIEVID